MLIIDGDYPMAGGAIRSQRDLTLPVEQARQAGPDFQGSPGRPDSGIMATIPEMRKAEVAVAIVKVLGCILRDGHPHGDVRTDELSYAAAQGQLAYYRILEARGASRMLKTQGDFIDHMNAWSETDNYDDLPVGMVLGMEGADPILWPEQVHEWYAEGLRVVSLSHYGVSRYSHGTATGTEGGLLDGAPRSAETHGLPRHDPRCVPHLGRIDQAGAGQLLRPGPFLSPELPRHNAGRTADP